MNYDNCMTMRTKGKPEKVDHNAIILRIIKSYIGDSNRRTQYQITDECIGRGGVNITTRRTRAIFVELIDEGALIIGTPNGGYYWAETEAEVMECYNRLRRKAVKEFIRARKLKRNWQAEKVRRQEMEQLEMFELAEVG